jgi:myo-inositol-1(or 4)-monophosphatase
MGLTDEVEARLAVALPLVEAAGQLTLGYFRRPLAIDNKLGAGAFDPVTAADREAEALLRAGLREAFPDDPVQGEEEGFTPGAGDWSWIIDPIDGTRAFISGMPAWGVLLGLLRDGRPVAGMVRQPYLDETFVGGPAGAFLLRAGERRPLATSGRTELGGAILYATHPGMFSDPAIRAGFERVGEAVLMTRFGGDCYSYCLLALGFVDLVIESGLQPYDIVPIIPLIEAAGGVVTGPDGTPPLAGGTVIAAASVPLHRRALALMRGEADRVAG